ncbi:hypothetical protein CBW65_10590 [Tumebacillus avium]|uniref:DUF4276 domain-containing protein n=1 Tax=Tumebacillus avium TaxID=1903704 RepID=A0A1Y0IMW9_9BACL|nr:hypothetical protein [Tumebacillus avium]ARU61399.1 hypothetical protein CBW65_10590 [Tumebacillus avium]
MSFKVLVITEDYVYDQHIVQPIVRKICEEAGKPNAKVIVCTNPRFRGFEDCTKIDRLKEEVIEMYKMVDLFLLLVDRDANEYRHEKLAGIEAQLKLSLRSNQSFITENAHQEIEVWALAGLDLPKGWSWAEIRSERDPKEKYFYKVSKEIAYLMIRIKDGLN